MTEEKTYFANQNVLENIKHLSLIEERDTAFQKIKDLETPNTAITKDSREDQMNQRRGLLLDLNNLLTEIKERDSISTQYQDTLDTNIANENESLQELKDKNSNKEDDINLTQRQSQLLEYQNYLNKETIFLLWILLPVLVICILIATFVDRLLLVVVLIGVIIFAYIVFLIQVLFVGNINLNIYDYREYDFNKPLPGEIVKEKSLNDKLLKYKAISNQKSNCGPPVLRTIDINELTNDPELDKIKADVGPADSERCLVDIKG